MGCSVCKENYFQSKQTNRTFQRRNPNQKSNDQDTDSYGSQSNEGSECESSRSSPSSGQQSKRRNSGLQPTLNNKKLIKLQKQNNLSVAKKGSDTAIQKQAYLKINKDQSLQIHNRIDQANSTQDNCNANNDPNQSRLLLQIKHNQSMDNISIVGQHKQNQIQILNDLSEWRCNAKGRKPPVTRLDVNESIKQYCPLDMDIPDSPNLLTDNDESCSSNNQDDCQQQMQDNFTENKQHQQVKDNQKHYESKNSQKQTNILGISFDRNNEQFSPIPFGGDTSGGNSAQLPQNNQKRKSILFREKRNLKVDIDVANQNSRHRNQPVHKIEKKGTRQNHNPPKRIETSALEQNHEQPSLILGKAKSSHHHHTQINLTGPENIQSQNDVVVAANSKSTIQQQYNMAKFKSQDTNKSNFGQNIGTISNLPSVPNTQQKSSVKLKIDVSVFVHEQKGKIKAKYRILETIGKGSYGEVKKIQHKQSGAMRAMKIIRKEDVTKEYMQSLINEIDILKQLDHPNIVRLYEFYQDKLNFYLITEFIEGGELFDKITKVKCFTESDAAKVMKQLLSAIVYCHNKKIVHRDLKPENLLIDAKNQDSLKVIDFGTSQMFDPNTKMHQKFGTPYYIAPEVLQRRYDEKCDIWSCGVIMYILLCGYPPFKGKNHKEIFDKIKTGKFSFAANEWKNVSREAKVMIKKMLTFKPEERVSAQQALDDEWIWSNTAKQTLKSNDQFHLPIMEDLINNLKKINVHSKLQQAVLTYFANYMNYDEEKKRLLDIFQAFDTNNDGQLDFKELVEGYTEYFNGDQQRAELEVSEIMEKLDINDNGNVDYSEFMIGHLNVSKMIQEDKLKEIFNLFDIDHSGTITAEELKKILGSKGNKKEEIDDNEWDKIIDEVDKDGNGEISFHEFKEMIYNMFNMKMKDQEENGDYEEELKDHDDYHGGNNQFKQQVSILQSIGTDKQPKKKRKRRTTVVTQKVKPRKSIKKGVTPGEEQSKDVNNNGVASSQQQIKDSSNEENQQQQQ